MSLDQDARLLKSVPLFSAFDPDQLRLVAFGAETIDLAEGAVLFEEGETADCGYLLLSGELVFVSRETGHETRVSDPGALVGELALLTETLRPATATAAVDTRVMAITRRLLRRVLEEYPAMAEIIRMTLAERIAALNDELKALRPSFEGRKD